MLLLNQRSQPDLNHNPQQGTPSPLRYLFPSMTYPVALSTSYSTNSEDTAVVFTTLPSPMEGVCESEAESVQFISDLEVLTLGLPPCLLVHSNSMTVTMNL
jgi:potassium/chloride transporter 9